ncbi:MAG: DUF4129 domain-containing protein [Planctomycetota bacterium]|nr:DUF4129 domain-containing protein [Planctomycetota bacterium]
MTHRHVLQKLRLLIFFLLALLTWGFDEDLGVLTLKNISLTFVIVGLPFLFNGRSYGEADSDDPFVAIVERFALSDFIFGLLLLLVFPDPIGSKSLSVLMALSSPMAFFMHIRRVRWVFFMNLSLALIFQAVLHPELVLLIVPYGLLTLALFHVQNLMDTDEEQMSSSIVSLIHSLSVGLIACFTIGLTAFLDDVLPPLPKINLLAAQQKSSPQSLPEFKMALLLFVPFIALGILFWRQMRNQSRGEGLGEKEEGEEEDISNFDLALEAWPPGPRKAVVLLYRQHLLKLSVHDRSKQSYESAKEFALRMAQQDPELKDSISELLQLFHSARYDPQTTQAEAPQRAKEAIQSIENKL